MTRVYAALDEAVLIATENGRGSWRGDWTDPGARIECLAVSPAVPDRVFVGTVDAGLRRSTDDGATWETVADPGDRVTAVTVSPQNPDTVWMGTEPSAVYRSTDGGDTWEGRAELTALPSADRWSFPPRPHTHHVRWIAVDPRDPDRLYVAIEAGAFVRSEDGGDTWIDHPDGARRDNHTIETHPDAPGRVYVAAGDGYAESPDGGDTWTYPQEELAERYVWGLTVAADDPDTVLVSAARGARAAHDPDGSSGVYRRRGDGAWQRTMDGLPGSDGWARPVLASSPDGFLALSNHGLFQSADGTDWTRLDVEWPESRRRELPRGVAVVG